MSSPALERWRTVGLVRLDELEAVHVHLTGTGPGRRWGTKQLNRSLFLALVAQFQSFCRDLHDGAVGVYIDEANPFQQAGLRELLLRGRRLGSHNPRRSTLGHDFGRLGISLIDELNAAGPLTRSRLAALDRVIDYRNAIAHGDEGEIEIVEAENDIRATKRSYQKHRRALDNLAGTMDDLLADRLGTLLAIESPW